MLRCAHSAGLVRLALLGAVGSVASLGVLLAACGRGAPAEGMAAEEMAAQETAAEEMAAEEMAAEDMAGRSPTDAEALRTLPYASWVPLEGDSRRGVTVHDRKRAQPGLNLFAPRHLARAFLIDMEGRTLHSWSARLPGGRAWQHVELTPDGGLLAVDKERLVIALDWDSKVRWSTRGEFHHDIAADVARRRVWAIERKLRTIEQDGESVTVVDDHLVALDAETGERREVLSVWDLVQRPVGAWRLAAIRRERAERGDAPPTSDSAADIFHVNSIEILGRDTPPVGRRGDLLISIREHDLVATVDPDARSIVWRWGPEILHRQHHPSLLANGHVLVFDNRPSDKASRVVELDSVSGEIVWTYRGDPPESFFSEKRGGAQRLANGNTLITESDTGRAFEVTASGEVVWEYLCPAVQKTAGGKQARAAFFRVTRIADPSRYGLDRRLAAEGST